ncbi:hypothetical protein B0H17DRAFT_1136670 [Mycena rosella]|uniref:Uncharacterized protein n=1 Tax=Mycena rosella TaxID=1033263 RepID=A0AAD7DAL9_MYCRO|nr:hypothetical protein B0H17DRAFT_1136670 [Mycena rosella]
MYQSKYGIVQIITWSQAGQAFHRVTHIARQQVKVATPVMRNAPCHRYCCFARSVILPDGLIAGIMRAGYQVFPSPEFRCGYCASSAIHQVHPERRCCLAKLVGAASLKRGDSELKIMPMPTFEDLFALSNPFEVLPPMYGQFRIWGYKDANYAMKDLPPFPKLSPSRIAFWWSRDLFRVNSSNALDFPYLKIGAYRLWPNRYMRPDFINNASVILYFYSFHLNPPIGCTDVPFVMKDLSFLFPNHSIDLMGSYPASLDGFLRLHNPTCPPTVPTPDRVFAGALATSSTLMFCVPAFLENALQELGSELDRLPLNNFRTVVSIASDSTDVWCIDDVPDFAGGPLQQSPPKEGWDYFYLSPYADPVFLPLPDIPGVYRLGVSSFFFLQSVKVLSSVAIEIQNPYTGGTGYGNRWSGGSKYQRFVPPTSAESQPLEHDQIMHSTGEKYGNIALQYPQSQFRGNSAQEYSNQICGDVWSRAFPCRGFVISGGAVRSRGQTTSGLVSPADMMTRIADLLKPIELTAKGTPRRQGVLDTYHREIQDVYVAVEESSQTHLTAPEEYNTTASLKFVRHLVAEVMLEMPGDDEDIFQRGWDSFQATWIRNSILHAL